MLKLYIGNKNYSSWSMRPWVLLTQAGIPFTEVQLKFTDDGKVAGIGELSPNGQVPVLVAIDQRARQRQEIADFRSANSL